MPLVSAVLFVALSGPVFAGGQKEGGAAQGATAAGGKTHIPIISKGFQHQFWQTVNLGAQEAATKYNVDITFDGPPSEADIQPQVQMLVNDMAKNPSAICLAALDTNSVMDQLNQAIQRKIPIIGFDSGSAQRAQGGHLRDSGHQQLRGRRIGGRQDVRGPQGQDRGGE